MKTNKQGTIITVIVLLVFTCLAGYFFATTKAASIEPELTTENIYAAINAERTEHGFIALDIDTRLETSACAKARDMDEKEYWAHDAPDGTEPWHFFTEAGYYYSRAGENLAHDNYSLKYLMNSWIDSPGHEANILGDFTDMGLCVLDTPSNRIIVNHFAHN